MRALLVVLTLLCGLLASSGVIGADDIVVIAHSGIAPVDRTLLQRLYTGRAVEVDGAPARIVNLPPGHPVREQFLSRVALLDDERYVAYWTVRRHIGKGAPPRELATPAQVVDFVQSTPGAIGYIPVSALRQGLNVVLRP